MKNNENEPTETGKKEIKRVNGRFAPGVSGNPGGSPKGRRTALVEIENAIEEWQQKNGVGYWTAVTNLAWTLAKDKGKTELLGKLMDKFLPSKYEADLTARPFTKMPEVMLKNGQPLAFEVGGDPKLSYQPIPPEA